MTNLNCSVGNCEHNKNNCCCNNSIKVGGASAESATNTCCDSFCPQSGSMTNDTRMAEPATEVACEACNCMYNASHSCCKDSIDVSGMNASVHENTQCSSFCHE